MAFYENIPGVEMEVNDGQLLMTDDRNSARMLIIGTVPEGVTDVPEEPVLIRSESELAANFGGFFVNGVENKLAMSWKAAQDLKNRRTYLMNIDGATAKDKFVKLHDQLLGYMADFAIDHVVLEGMYADEVVSGLQASDFGIPEYQEAFPVIPGVIKMGYVLRGVTPTVQFPLTVATGTNDTITLVDTSVTRTDKVITVAPGSYQDLLALGTALETALVKVYPKGQVLVRDGVVEIILDKSFELKATTGLAGSIGFKTVGAATYKEHAEGSIVVGSFAHLLGEYAKQQSLMNNATIAYIGVKPVADTSLRSLKDFVDNLVKRSNDVNPYLQVVVGPELGINVPGSLRTHFLSGVTHYAGLVQGLTPESAPTNKVISGITVMRYALSLRQLNALTGNKYVTFRIRNANVIVVDGVTTAPDIVVGKDTMKSDFTRLSTLRITNAMTQRVRRVCEPFIGQPNEMPQYNAMNAAVKGEIEQAIKDREIQNAKFTIRVGNTLDTAIIRLDILPQFELRKIPVTIALTTPDNF